jgi:hypothetical protein
MPHSSSPDGVSFIKSALSALFPSSTPCFMYPAMKTFDPFPL